jgi:DNA-binding beta-propeller fold protein YncE
MRHQLLLPAFILTCLITSPAPAQTQPKPRRCNQPSPDPIVHVELPGHPFSAVPTRDGCFVFVSITASRAKTQNGIAVVQRSGGKASLLRVVPTAGSPSGMTLTRDGKLAVAAAWNRILFLDAGRLISGAADAVLGALQYEKEPGSIYVNVSSDDRLLFVSEESTQTITVIDLAKARASGFQPGSIIGRIPVGIAPIALTFSPDGRLLYTTSQRAPESAAWPLACAPEGKPAAESAPRFPQGAVMVVDVARARTDPAHAVVAMAPAGCNPVRLALSPKGDVAYVTARGNHALLVLDTRQIVRDPQHAILARVPVGTSPVGVALDRTGRRIFATSSNRFAGVANDKQFLTVVDATRVQSGAAAVLGAIPAGGFPRELKLTADQRTLLVTNFVSGTLELVDLARLPLSPPPPR